MQKFHFDVNFDHPKWSPMANLKNSLSEMVCNASESEFWTSKMAAIGHFENSCVLI
jgi:hypothetical protein